MNQHGDEELSDVSEELTESDYSKSGDDVPTDDVPTDDVPTDDVPIINSTPEETNEEMKVINTVIGLGKLLFDNSPDNGHFLPIIPEMIVNSHLEKRFIRVPELLGIGKTFIVFNETYSY